MYTNFALKSFLIWNLSVCAFAPFVHGTPLTTRDKEESPATCVPVKFHELATLHKLFISTFLQVYKDAPDVAETNVEMLNHLETAFERLYNHYMQGKTRIHVVWENRHIVGFIGFSALEIDSDSAYDHAVYVDQLVVLPSHWGQGLGRLLLSSMLQACPETERVFLVTRKINDRSQNFFKSLGFVEDTYMHAGYDTSQYMGYQLTLQSSAP